MKKLHSSSDQSCRKLCKVFGEKFSMKGDEKEKKIKDFQEKLMSNIVTNGGSLRCVIIKLRVFLGSYLII